VVYYNHLRKINYTSDFYNASAHILHMVNDTASKIVTHPSLAGEAVSAAIGFTTGFALGGVNKRFLLCLLNRRICQNLK